MTRALSAMAFTLWIAIFLASGDMLAFCVCMAWPWFWYTTDCA